MLTFKRGQSFNFTGQMMDKTTGQPYPLTDYVLRSDIRSKVNFALIQSLTCTILDGPTAMINITATPAQTVLWPVTPSVMDIRLEDTAGNVLISNDIDLDIVDRCTQ